MRTQVYNLNGESVGEIDLPDAVFGRKWNPDLVHQALMAQVGNRRQPLAYAKGRGEVRGGGKKPWRQKGTGRARHGSIRSPLWKGGGVTHGPTKEKNYEKKINKKMKRAAIFAVLSKRLTEGALKIVDSFKFNSPRTKELNTALTRFLNQPKNSKKLSVLIIPNKENKIIFRISANIPKAKSLGANSLNVEDLLKYKNILMEKNAVTELSDANKSRIHANDANKSS